MKYPTVAHLRFKHKIATCCRLLDVSRSGFYEWTKKDHQKIWDDEVNFDANVLSFFKKNRECYGSPRIQQELIKNGMKCSKNKVAKSMKKQNLIACRRRTYRPQTTVNNPDQTKAPRVFEIENLNEVWVSDLTYIPFRETFLYLVVVLDLFNREVISWSLSDSMHAQHTEDTITDAIRNCGGSLNGLVFHSDQGSQYGSRRVGKKLEFLSITQSMSRRGNCYDNAFAESFFHTFKNEFRADHYADQSELEEAISDYLFWYNHDRMHSSLDYQSPVDF